MKRKLDTSPIPSPTQGTIRHKRRWKRSKLPTARYVRFPTPLLLCPAGRGINIEEGGSSGLIILQRSPRIKDLDSPGKIVIAEIVSVSKDYARLIKEYRRRAMTEFPVSSFALWRMSHLS